MAQDKKVKVSYEIVNGKSKQAISEIGTAVGNLNREFKLQTEQMKLNASESEKLQVKLEHLKEKYELAKKKTDECKVALESAKNQFGENSKEAAKWSKELINAQTAEAKLKNSIAETNIKLDEARLKESEATKASEARKKKLDELSKAHDGLKSSSEKLSKEYDLQVKSLGDNAKEADKLRAKQEYLNKATLNSAEQVKNLESQLKVAKKEYGENSAEVNKLEKELLDAKIATKDFENEYKKVDKTLNDVESSLNKTAKTLKKVGDKTKEIGVGLSKGVTAPIVAAGAGSIQAFKEIDNGLDTIIVKTGATGEAAKNLEKSFNNVYSSFPADAEKVGNVIGELNTQFGLLGSELENKAILMLKFAQINGQDVTNSTIQAKQAIEAFNLKGKDLDLVLDSITKTGQNTGVSVDKLFDSVIKGAPALQGLGLGFSESVAIMGRFEQSGIDSSKAISYLTKAQTNWAKEGKSMKDGLSELTVSIKNAKTEQEAIALASEVFGTKAAPMMAKAIKDGKLSFDEFSNSANLAKGAVNGTFEETKNPIDDFTTAMNNLKLVGAEIAKQLQETLAPILKEFIEKLKAFSEWFKKLNPETKEIIVSLHFTLQH